MNIQDYLKKTKPYEYSCEISARIEAGMMFITHNASKYGFDDLIEIEIPQSKEQLIDSLEILEKLFSRFFNEKTKENDFKFVLKNIDLNKGTYIYNLNHFLAYLATSLMSLNFNNQYNDDRLP